MKGDLMREASGTGSTRSGPGKRTTKTQRAAKMQRTAKILRTVKMQRTTKILRIVIIVIVCICLLCIINFIPVFSLNTSGMNVLEGKWVNVYYEQEKDAAVDVFDHADAETEAIARKLGFSEKQDINVYIYDSQSKMQMKKYGIIGSLLRLDWYIGDNIGTDVILASPANPGPMHSYDSVRDAVLHEIVHAYISVLNPDIQLWLTEGTALYLSNGEKFYKEYLDYMPIPGYRDTLTRNPVKFANYGGYTFSQTYVEYIDVTYGWDSVLQLLKTEDYQECFGKSQEEIYEEWAAFIRDYYQ